MYGREATSQGVENDLLLVTGDLYWGSLGEGGSIGKIRRRCIEVNGCAARTVDDLQKSIAYDPVGSRVGNKG